MKVTRLKRIRKLLKYFLLNFNLRAPYRIILEGGFIQAALENQVLIREQVPQMMQSDCKLYVTRCILNELKNGGKFYSGATSIASQFPLFTCTHGGTVSGHECIMSIIGKNNSEHVVVAAQTFSLREKVRKVPGVPIVYMQGQVPLLDELTQREHSVQKLEESKQGANKDEKKAAELIIKQMVAPASIVQSEEAERLKKKEKQAAFQKKKKPKAPNPLSCKKSKKALALPSSSVVSSSDSSKTNSKREALPVNEPLNSSSISAPTFTTPSTYAVAADSSSESTLVSHRSSNPDKKRKAAELSSSSTTSHESFSPDLDQIQSLSPIIPMKTGESDDSDADDDTDHLNKNDDAHKKKKKTRRGRRKLSQKHQEL